MPFFFCLFLKTKINREIRVVVGVYIHIYLYVFFFFFFFYIKTNNHASGENTISILRPRGTTCTRALCVTWTKSLLVFDRQFFTHCSSLLVKSCHALHTQTVGLLMLQILLLNGLPWFVVIFRSLSIIQFHQRLEVNTAVHYTDKQTTKNSLWKD